MVVIIENCIIYVTYLHVGFLVIVVNIASINYNELP